MQHDSTGRAGKPRKHRGPPRPHAPIPDSPLLDARAAAAFLGIGVPTLWTKCGGDSGIPAPIYPVRRRPRWVRKELEAYVAKLMAARPAKGAA